MRELEYVKFLSETPDFDVRFHNIYMEARNYYEVGDYRDRNFRDPFIGYRAALKLMTGQPYRIDPRAADFIPDNHGGGVELLTGLKAAGSSTWFRNVLIDWMIPHAFGIENCDIVSNSANQVYYEALRQKSPTSQESRLIGNQRRIKHQLVAGVLPNYLNSDGPYHPCLEELRNHQYLEEARSYIDELIIENQADEIEKICKNITELAHNIRDEVFTKHLSKSREYWVYCKAAIAELVGLFIPGIGLVTTVLEECKAARGRARIRWARFVTDIEKIKVQSEDATIDQ